MGKVKDFDNLEEYEDFDNEYEDYDEEYDEDDLNEIEDSDYKENTISNKENFINYINLLKFISIWFIRIGIAAAIGLLIMFFVTGEILTAFIYIFGLISSFAIGYIFMYLLDRMMIKLKRN